ncbi:hypothetical protein WJU23_20015 [Prosthecobacter sp. SYSU 5D2]|uniref:hypothetical protein n=1 Tax=Prosthecobacter sp. SYSU 5D2 TaxID=3134134 RepID=UPI0031FE77E2
MSRLVVLKILALMLLQACESRCQTQGLNHSRIHELDGLMRKLNTTSLKEVLMWDGIVFSKSDHVHLDRATGAFKICGTPQFRAQAAIWLNEVNRGRIQEMMAGLDAQTSCFP